MMKNLIATMLVISFSLPLAAQDTEFVTADTVSENTDPAILDTVSNPKAESLVPQQSLNSELGVNSLVLERRIQTLENQFDIVQNYNDDFLSIVVWSFGTLSAIAVLLIGFNWFQSSRTLRSEFDALQQELTAAKKQTESQVDEKIKVELVQAIETIKKTASKTAEEKVNPVKGAIELIRSELVEVQYKLIESEVKHWQRIPVPINAVNTCSELIECALKTNQEWRISTAIDSLSDSIKLMEDDDSKLEAIDFAELESVLKKLPDSLGTARDVMLNRLMGLHR